MRACPVCNAQDAEVMRAFQFALPDDYPLPDHYNTVACNRCGMVYADTEATQADYDKFYRELNKYALRCEGPMPLFWEGSADRIKQHLWRSARILDIGCANGELLSLLKQFGYDDLTGIDPSRKSANGNGIPILTGTLSNLPGGIGKFDFIILTHVIEHVCDVRGAMRSIKNLLRPQGQVYLEVPNSSEQYSARNSGPYQEINTEHINFFSEQCLRNLASVHSMRVVMAGEALAGTFPVVYLIADASSPVPMKQDKILKDRIRAYLDESEQSMTVYCEHLAQDLGETKEVALWGAGELAMKMLRLKPLCDLKIAAIIDSSPIKQSYKFGGVKVIPPDKVKKKDWPIVITSVIHRESVKQSISSAGLQNPVVELRA